MSDIDLIQFILIGALLTGMNYLLWRTKDE